MKKHGFKVNPFKDDQQSEVTRFPNGKWGWWIYPSLGEERSSEDFPTRQAAREARRENAEKLRGTGSAAERRFKNS
jgi:hypothetical protein